MKNFLRHIISLFALSGCISTVFAQPWTNENVDTFFTPHAESDYRIFRKGPAPDQVLNTLPGNGWLTMQVGDTAWLARPVAEGKWEGWSLLSRTFEDQQSDFSWQPILMDGRKCWLLIACDQFSHTAATHQNGNKTLRVQYWDLTTRPRLLLSADETAVGMSAGFDDEGNHYTSQQGKLVCNRLEGGKRFSSVAVWEGDSVICHYETEWKREQDGWHFAQLKNLPLPADVAELRSLFPAHCWPACLYWFETKFWDGRP
jgi:hypothetical protein